jgi:DNA-binding transcriptional LysR family regulator
MLRKGHPASRGAFTLERYASLSHVAISPGGAGIYGQRIDSLLKTQSVRRRVILTVPSFLAVPYVVARTDYIATVPGRLARYFADLLPLAIVEAPLPLPAFELSMFWHERVHHDLANVWLRQEVVEATRELLA